MILTSYDSSWPPRRLPSRLRVARVVLARARPLQLVMSVARRLAAWTAWLGFGTAVFLAVDLYL